MLRHVCVVPCRNIKTVVLNPTSCVCKRKFLFAACFKFTAPKTSDIVYCRFKVVCGFFFFFFCIVTSFPSMGIIHPVECWGGKCHYAKIADIQLDLRGIWCVCVLGGMEAMKKEKAREVDLESLFNHPGAVMYTTAHTHTLSTRMDKELTIPLWCVCMCVCAYYQF